ncbi:MAG: hypothetical protein Q9160_002551 [Pyrenula sp. 1 TL-2023]
MEQLSKSDPWVDLQGPECDAAKKFLGFTCPAVIHSGDLILPRPLDEKGPGPVLSFGFWGGHIAPRIVLQLKVSGSNLRKTTDIKVEIFPSHPRHLEKLDVVPIGRRTRLVGPCEHGKAEDKNDGQGSCGGRDPTQNKHGSSRKSLFSIDLYNVSGIGSGLDISPQDFDRVTRLTLNELRLIAQGKFDRLKITINADPASQKGLLALKERLEDYKKRLPWWPYRDINGKAMCSFMNMVSRKTVQGRSGGLIRYTSQNSFASPTEAFIKLSYGAFLEHRTKRAQEIRKYKDRPPNVHVDEVVEHRLRAIALAYGPDRHETSKKFLRTLLNHEVQALRLFSPLSGTTHLTEQHATVRRKPVIDAFSWNEDQLRAIDMGCRSLRGYVGLIAGPSGSGRTTTLAGLACAYRACDASVMMFAPTASAARALKDKTYTLFTKTFGRTPWHEIYALIPGDPNYKDVERGAMPEEVAKAEILITVPCATRFPAISKTFAESARATVIMHDDAYHFQEADMLATIFTVCPLKIIGLICILDLKEWYMDVATKTDPFRQMRRKEDKKNSHYQQFLDFFYYNSTGDKYPTNLEGFEPKGEYDFIYGRSEFADQIGLCLPTRLSRQGFPVTVLSRQERMTPKLAAFPDQRSYKGIQPPPKFTHRESTESPRILNIIYDWLGIAPRDSPVMFINVPKSLCYKDRHRAESKKNEPNAGAISNLLAFIDKKSPAELEETVILVPYADQYRLYAEKVLPRLAVELGTSTENLPKATTVESMRGHEAKYIIYDLVVTSGDRSHGMGIVMDNFLAHLASTRASEAFIIFGSEDILNVFPQFWACLNEFERKRGRPLPYIAEYVLELARKRLVFQAPVEEYTSYGFQSDERWHRPQSETHAVWEKSFAREEAAY